MSRKMKDSGIEWIGNIPDNWEIGYIGQIYTERKQKVSDWDYAPLSVTMNGIVPQLSTAAKTDAHDDRKLVKKGDFAINSRSDRRGSCGIAPMDGSISLINTVLKPKEEMNPDYYNWLFHTSMFSDEFYKWGHGIVDDLWTTNWSDMKKIAIPIPALKEQRTISNFLNNKCSCIDNIITKTQESIEEYKKLKQSIITQAVTKGVRGDREMKESGCKWIDVIPKEWKVLKLKYLFSNGKGLPITKDNLIESGLPVISYGQIHSPNNNGVNISEDLLRFVDYSYQNEYPQCQVFKNDFIFADTSEDYTGCGNCVYKRDNGMLFSGYHTIILHSKNNNDNLYFAYLFKTDAWRKQIREVASGVKLFSVSQKTLLNTTVVIPLIDEQKQIADYLDTKCDAIDDIIKKKEKIIIEMVYLKQSLIYEYVTGKKEVI